MFYFFAVLLFYIQLLECFCLLKPVLSNVLLTTLTFKFDFLKHYAIFYFIFQTLIILSQLQ